MQGQAQDLVLQSRYSAPGSYLPLGKGALHAKPRPVLALVELAQILKLWIPCSTQEQSTTIEPARAGV